MEEYKFTQFFSRHFWTLAVGTCVVIACGVFLNRQITANTIEKKHDFLTMKTVFEKMGGKEPLSSEALERASEILARRPELHSQYDISMALSYFSLGNCKKATPFIESCLKRGNNETSSFFYRFAENSLLIANENYPDALSSAQQLEEDLKGNSSYETLRAFNLLRLAFLSQKLGHVEGQKTALSTLVTLPASQNLTSLFEEGSFTFKNYFQT